MRVRVEMDGFFRIASRYSSWMGFAAHAVDWHAPFLSETGYRSFLGVGGALTPGYTPDAFAKDIVTAHVQFALKGKLLSIRRDFRPSRARTDRPWRDGETRI